MRGVRANSDDEPRGRGWRSMHLWVWDEDDWVVRGKGRGGEVERVGRVIIADVVW